MNDTMLSRNPTFSFNPQFCCKKTLKFRPVASGEAGAYHEVYQSKKTDIRARSDTLLWLNALPTHLPKRGRSRCREVVMLGESLLR